MEGNLKGFQTMSDLKRYEIGVDFIAPVFVPVETEVGDWVKYVDYARLKAEVERLTEQKEHLWNKCTPHMKAGYDTHELLLKEARAKAMRLEAEVERLTAFTTRTIIPNEELQAQVERLTKAGDATSQRLHWFCQKWGWKDDDLKTLTPEWNAAKEGKQP
jgi:hypothetical protein